MCMTQSAKSKTKNKQTKQTRDKEVGFSIAFCIHLVTIHLNKKLQI